MKPSTQLFIFILNILNIGIILKYPHILGILFNVLFMGIILIVADLIDKPNKQAKEKKHE